MTRKRKIYDLEERTAKFGEDVIKFCKKVTKNQITTPMISQLVRSATSVGANYSEADDTRNQKKILNTKLGFVRKNLGSLNIG